MRQAARGAARGGRRRRGPAGGAPGPKTPPCAVSALAREDRSSYYAGMLESPALARPSARADVALRRVGSEWVLYDPVGDRAHVLNPTAAAVWAFCDGGHDPASMADAIAQGIPAAEPAAIRRDIDDVLRRFASEGLLR